MSKDDWIETGLPPRICLLNLYTGNLKEDFQLEFFNYEQSGLGIFEASVVKVEETLYWIEALKDETGSLCRIEDDTDSDNPNKAAFKVQIFINSNTTDSRIALDYFLNAFDPERKSSFGITKELGPAVWQLCRIDDNNVEFEIERFLNEVSANSHKKAFEKNKHKQTYFVRKL